MTPLDEAVRQLHIHRELHAAETASIVAQRAQFETTIAFDVANQKALAEQVAADEQAVRDEALKVYRRTDNKHSHPAVEIKERRKASIPNLARAFAWAKERMPLVILPESLDQKALMDFALKSKTPVPFVEIKKEPTAQIASDLSKALIAEEETVPA
jgi:hypothetical protein